MPAPSARRYESLDVWRGVACLSVLVFHATLFTATPGLWDRVLASGGTATEWALALTIQGKFGVPLFFVVSGYCITAAAVAVQEGRHGTGAFFVRRVRRIYPPYWVLLATVVVVAAALPDAWLPASAPDELGLLPRPGTLTPAQWFGAVTLTEEWRPVVAGPPKQHFLNHAWTLCYEEQFYAVVGLTLVLSRRYFYPLVAVVTAAVYLNVTDLNALLGTRLGIELNRYQLHAPGTFLDGMWLAFAAGVGVHYAVTGRSPSARRAIILLLLGGLAWAARPLDALLGYHTTLAKCLTTAFPFALLLIVLHRYDRIVAAARIFAPLRFCGRMCYSLYLVHAPVCVLLGWACYRAGLTGPVQSLAITLPACLVSSLVAGLTFHRFVERRYLNSNDATRAETVGARRPAVEPATGPARPEEVRPSYHSSRGVIRVTSPSKS
jgi:peptidoglycan/LPS O-acetylase OafA/YrhL